MMRKFILYAIVLSMAIWVFSFLWGTILNLHLLFNLLIGFFLGQTLIIGWIMTLVDKESTQSPIIIVGITGFRMITGLTLLLVFYFFSVSNLTELFVQFFVLYLVYMVFELSFLLTNLRPNSRGVSPNESEVEN